MVASNVNIKFVMNALIKRRNKSWNVYFMILKITIIWKIKNLILILMPKKSAT